MNNNFNGQTQQNFTRRSSLSDGYYYSLDDRLTARRLIKGLGYASAFAFVATAVLYVGAQVGF